MGIYGEPSGNGGSGEEILTSPTMAVEGDSVSMW